MSEDDSRGEEEVKEEEEAETDSGAKTEEEAASGEGEGEGEGDDKGEDQPPPKKRGRKPGASPAAKKAKKEKGEWCPSLLSHDLGIMKCVYSALLLVVTVIKTSYSRDSQQHHSGVVDHNVCIFACLPLL